jgi:hypothetical protein
MTNTLHYRIAAFARAVLLTTPFASAVLAQGDKTNTVADVQNVSVGAFTVKIPRSSKSFSATDAAQLRRQYVMQSQEIYRQFSGADDPTKTVDVVAFHVNGTGSFVLVAFTVPPTSNLIALLKNQAKDKADWGVREGYIRKYLGLVSVDNKYFSGFYTKAIGRNGGVQISGGLEHKNLKNTIIQLTLLAPGAWPESKATSTLTSILDSVALRWR